MNRLVGRWGWWLAMGLPLLAFLLIPIVAIVLGIFGSRTGVTDEVTQAIRLTLETSLLSIAAIVLLGTPLAFAIARFKFPFRGLIGVCVDLPIVLPPAAAGIGLLLAFGRHGLIPTSIAFTTTAVVMAQSFVASPFYVRAAILAFSNADLNVEESAAMDGATPLALFSKITLPITAKALVSGGITSWARAVGEFGATILFAGNLVGKTQTMPLAIYLGFESDLGLCTLLSGILLGVAFAAIVGVRLLTDRATKRFE